MMIEVLKSKIHCARVTEANLNYMGSITIDEDLLDAANMIAGEKVYIADMVNALKPTLSKVNAVRVKFA
jgi:aspartate 1-decarboxylase